MPPKKIQGRAATSRSAKKPVQSFVVQHGGSRNQARTSKVKPSASQTAGATAPSAAELLTLQQEIIEDWGEDFEVPGSMIPPTETTTQDGPVAELDELLDDAFETYAEGQNEMLKVWRRKWSDTYLRELLRIHRPPDVSGCSCGSGQQALYACTDCMMSGRFCNACLLQAHRFTPCHRISKWTGAHWKRATLKAEGFVLDLADHPSKCRNFTTMEFILGDLTGMHKIDVSFCNCPLAPEAPIQLLRRQILTCSEEDPSSGFTFSVLRLFHLASTEAKLSSNRFYHLLQRSTNNTKPHEYPNRFREFMRASREWMFLQDLKRAGCEKPESARLQGIALRCPACPRLDVNYLAEDEVTDEEFLYAQQLNYDGSFQLVRKNKAVDAHNICLSDGLKYWVEQAAYHAHLLANKDTAYAQSTRGSACNNHRAANDTWVRATGVAESGVGAVTCARHTFYLPQGVVSYFKGERFSYTDFAIASVMQMLMGEGAKSIGVFYYIYCHWHKGFWTRAPSILLPGGILQQPDRFFGGIPKYHLAGHTDSCYAQYSLNNMQGVGRLDAEGCERAWADLNQASGSTSEKGPGARIDSLNHCMQDWNWKKTVSMVSTLITKWADASRNAAEQEDMWLAFHTTLDPELTGVWESMSTEPKYDNGTWTSVFLMKETQTTSITRALLELNRLEQEDAQTSQVNEPGLTAPSWVSEGMDIEYQQQRIIADMKSYGSSLTEKQTLDIFHRRSSLSTRITRHRNDASHFLDIAPSSISAAASIAEETDGRPELASLYMPSRLGALLRPTQKSIRVVNMELKLRRVACYRALQRVRSTTIQKAQLLSAKRSHARGEIANTRAQNMVNRLSQRIDMAIWEYRNAREAILRLDPNHEDLTKLKKLSKDDLSGLSSILTGTRELGEGSRKLPWFWTLRGGSGDESADDVQWELNEATRVEWFRGRERFRRWKEEELWLRRELASVLFDFRHRSEKWRTLKSSDFASVYPGYKAYCDRQEALWSDLCNDGFKRCRHILEPRIAICARALLVFRPENATERS